MSKRALLVGVNKFGPGIPELRGCINDTVEMGRLLQDYFGFQEADIRVRHDGDASAQNIRDGLGWLLSEYDGDGRDVRVFHFSSHGTQVDDQSDDEWECMDEVIVPYDHDWDDPFRDDELRAIFDVIPEGVNFTFIADCCHSGSIQKALVDSSLRFQPRYLTPPPEVADRILAKQEKPTYRLKNWPRTCKRTWRGCASVSKRISMRSFPPSGTFCWLHARIDRPRLTLRLTVSGAGRSPGPWARPSGTPTAT
jgi:hypothetical protein